MEKAMQELKFIIRELVLEVGELKERVSRLENGNIAKNNEIEQPGHPVLEMEGEGYENLGRIYSQGYHVCPMAYGKPRNGECLFCISFLEKE